MVRLWWDSLWQGRVQMLTGSSSSPRPGRSKVDYDNVLADSEREAVADLLNYLENVRGRFGHLIGAKG